MTKFPLKIALLILVCATLAVFVACGGNSAPRPTTAGVAPPGLTSVAEVAEETGVLGVALRTPTPARINGLRTVTLERLPPEVAVTLRLIERGGPFPYRQDGQVFQNREGILPSERSGFYHEYTVNTPGSDDRAARRLVAGEDGYHTDDHYDSFRVILP